MTILHTDNLHFTYGNPHRPKELFPVLSGVSFSISQGESVGLVGANGVGKSTLLKLICGLLEPTAGSVTVSGLQVCRDNLAQVRKDLGYVFQDADNQLFTSTVYDDVAFAPLNYGYTPVQAREAVDRALKAVHIEELRDRAVYRLSGGEKKLASIATVLSVQSKLLVMDEPTVALDPRNRRNLIGIINSLPGAKLIASHDLDFIYDTCSRTILLSQGRVVADAPTPQVLQDRPLLETHGLELPLSFSRSRD